MDIQVVPIKKLNPAVYNPRKQLKPGDSAYAALERSINEYGYIDPIIWNKATGNVVGGHQRLAVLKRLGHKEIQVSVVNLSLDKEKALNIALNKIAGEWDEDLLTSLFEELGEDSLALTGFDMDEIEELLGLPDYGDEPDKDGEPYLDDPGITYENQYGVIVQCDSELAQKLVYEKLVSMGYACKVVVV